MNESLQNRHHGLRKWLPMMVLGTTVLVTVFDAALLGVAMVARALANAPLQARPKEPSRWRRLAHTCERSRPHTLSAADLPAPDHPDLAP